MLWQKFPSQSLQKRLRPLPLRKQLLLRIELRRVHAPPAAAQPYRMFQMQHLVINNVLNGEAGNRRVIENAADHNRIVRRIVVPQNPPRPRRAPAHARPPHQSIKKSPVQILKDRVQIVNMPLRRTQPLAPTHLSHQMRLVYHIMAAHIFPVARRL